MLFDTHAHLLEASAKQLACLAHPALNVTTDISQWQAAISLSKQYPKIYCALGIHPWFVNEQSVADITVLEDFIQREKVHALGEIGLDFQKPFLANKALQLDVFELQLALALHHRLPVSIHAIKSHNETLQLLKEYPVKGVIHGLGASIEIAKGYIDLGMKIGVNGVLCRENAVRYHKLVTDLGLQPLVLETDFPNVLLPEHSFSELADVQAVASMVANLTQLTPSAVIAQTGYNAQKLFSDK